MAEAKITIKTLVDNKELQDLNKELANGSQNLKQLQADLKKAEKEHGVASDAAKKLRQELEMQRTTNKALAREINNTSKALSGQSNAMSSLGDMAKQFGINIDFSMSKLSAMATAAVAVGSALVASARDVSALSNQFIAFAGNAKQAEIMYSLFNDVYRNTNYDEQKVMDMAKSMMRIGLSAQESADLITVCADASAGLGQGAEFAEQLAQTLAKVKTGGELSEKQLQQLAQAGIDLNNVQADIKAGGEKAYEALKNKLGEFEGSMQKAKGTAAEMEGDIKGNVIQIGRELALLVDDIFGFSDALKQFYQWVIDTSQMVIDKIRAMRNALSQSVAAADEYGRALQEWEDIYGDTFQGSDEERALAASNYASACAEIAKEKKAEAQAEEQLLALEKKKVQVRSIAGGGSSSGGGSSHVAKTATPKEAKQEDPFALMIKQHKMAMDNTKAELDYKLAAGLIEKEAYKTAMEERRVDNNKWVEEQLQVEALTLEQKVALWKEYMAKTTEVQKTQSEQVNKYWDGMAKTFAKGMAECIMGAKSFGDAFKEIIKKIIQQLIEAAIYAAIVASFSGGTMSFGEAFKGSLGITPKKKANGGYISGPGSGTSDSIPARLSNGEYVLNADAVKAIGIDNLNRVNFGARHFADGGAVAPMGGSVTVNISAVDASGFGDFLARGGLDSIKQALFEDDRTFGSTVGLF